MADCHGTIVVGTVRIRFCLCARTSTWLRAQLHENKTACTASSSGDFNIDAIAGTGDDETGAFGFNYQAPRAESEDYEALIEASIGRFVSFPP